MTTTAYETKSVERWRESWAPCQEQNNGWGRNVDQGSMHGPSLWTGSMDHFHGKGPWIPVMARSMDTFFK